MAEEKDPIIKEAKEDFEEILSEGVLKEIREYEESSIREKARLKSIAMEEGMEKGVKTGKEERNIEIAKKLLRMNYKIEDIMEITELSKEEIIELKK